MASAAPARTAARRAALHLVSRAATTATPVREVIVRLLTDGGTSRRSSGHHHAANILSTATGTQNTHRVGFTGADGSASWLYVGQRAGHPSCLDLTLQAARYAGRPTAWHYGRMQKHTSGTGRGGLGGGLYLSAEAHDAVQLRAVGTAADIVAFDLTLYGIQ